MTGVTRAREQSAPLVNRENPWPGLAAFSEEHAEFFHGREREVDDLFRRVRFNALSVLYGQSGLGKTSLVQAALFPRLRGIGVLPVSIRVDYSPPAADLSGGERRGAGGRRRLGETGGAGEPLGVFPPRAPRPAEQIRILREAEELNRHYRENQLWAARRAANSVRPSGRREADSTVASALGNLSWSYLMVGRPRDAADSARVGTRVFAPLTFILPNLFNGLVLSGDPAAAGFFRSNATRMVEAQPVRFACAAVRDIRELRWRGVATEAHVATVEGLAAPHLDQCQFPKLPTP